jgi:serine/threonine protein kinase
MTPDEELKTLNREWQIDPGSPDLQRRYHALLDRCVGFDNLPDFVGTKGPMPARMGRFVVHRIIDLNSSTQPLLCYDPPNQSMCVIRLLRHHAFGSSDRVFSKSDWKALEDISKAIVPLEWGSIDGVDFYRVRYEPGLTLASVLKSQTLPLLSKLKTIRQITEIMTEVHGRAGLHSWLTANNVLVHEDNSRVFGFEKWQLEEQRRSWSLSVALIFPKIHSWSPEQILGESFGVQSDIYQLGHILFEALTEGYPFILDKPKLGQAVVKAVLGNHVNLPLMRVLKLPRCAEELCVSALSRQPVDRPKSMADFAKALSLLEAADWTAYENQIVKQRQRLTQGRAGSCE